MPVPNARGSPRSLARLGLALGGLLTLAACAEPPTSTTAGSDVHAPVPPTSLPLQPTVSPLVTAECPAGTTTASGALPGSGALYLICVPPAWNGTLVVYAHGFVNPFDPVAIQDDVVGGSKVSEIVTGLGVAFATTSYRDNGLIVFEAEQDLLRLVQTFDRLFGPPPGPTLAVGVSEGAQTSVLAAERNPQLFNGVLAACGAIGDFAAQINHFDDASGRQQRRAALRGGPVGLELDQGQVRYGWQAVGPGRDDPQPVRPRRTLLPGGALRGEGAAGGCVSVPHPDPRAAACIAGWALRVHAGRGAGSICAAGVAGGGAGIGRALTDVLLDVGRWGEGMVGDPPRSS
jgi:hypothetical protein